MILETEEKFDKDNNSMKTQGDKESAWKRFEKGLSMFSPDFMADGRNQPDLPKGGDGLDSI